MRTLLLLPAIYLLFCDGLFAQPQKGDIILNGHLYGSMDILNPNQRYQITTRSGISFGYFFRDNFSLDAGTGLDGYFYEGTNSFQSRSLGLSSQVTGTLYLGRGKLQPFLRAIGGAGSQWAVETRDGVLYRSQQEFIGLGTGFGLAYWLSHQVVARASLNINVYEHTFDRATNSTEIENNFGGLYWSLGYIWSRRSQ
ncbi:MAG TPA: hypothetical protein DCE41_17385 [Cytophagales bacterium]|nr:hypothetical protein [Cytophagales bacterium]HAA20234.1 hypothetical protein [Cytophagales bacterium]HAP61768.1 hypothetical protein [Cytophagales bacterium]